MRKVVAVLIIVMAASMLAACGSTPPATTSTTPAPVAVTPTTTGRGTTTGQTGAVVAATGDTLSPTQTVEPGKTLSTDPTIVPASILANVTAHKPMLLFWYDPTTRVAADQLKEINAALKKYTGAITLVPLDYTVGITSTAASTTVDPETQKLEVFAGSLQIKTTPYMVFVDQYGRITYRFAGIADKGLLTREVLRATR